MIKGIKNCRFVRLFLFMMLLNLLCRLQLHSRSLANKYYRFRMISSTISALDTLYPMGLYTIIGHG